MKMALHHFISSLANGRAVSIVAVDRFGWMVVRHGSTRRQARGYRVPAGCVGELHGSALADNFAAVRKERRMDYRTATPADLVEIFKDLARRMADQYATAGLNIDEVKDEFMMCLKEGRGHTLLQDGQPVAIIAWREADDAAQTAFAAHESFFSRSSVRFCKKHIRRIQALCGNLPIHSYSWSDRPEVMKWFRILGFDERERGNGYVVFELDPA
jgi:hypothetical protein